MIQSISAGDIFVGKSIYSSPVMIIETNYSHNIDNIKYNFAGFNGLKCFSSFGESVGKTEIINYLNKNNYVFAINLNEKIINSLKWAYDFVQNGIKEENKAKELEIKKDNYITFNGKNYIEITNLTYVIKADDIAAYKTDKANFVFSSVGMNLKTAQEIWENYHWYTLAN